MPYTIIGGDAQQYGPIAEEEVRRWIAEGRLNAQSMAKTESDAVFHPLSEFPEFADAFTSPLPPPLMPPGPASSAEWLARDYNLDIGRCISGGWTLVKKNFWPVVGINFLVMLAIIVPNQIISVFTRPTMNGIIKRAQISF
jgi:hypothetical protein